MNVDVLCTKNQEFEAMFSAQPTSLPGVVLIQTPVYRDTRGHFLEIWKLHKYSEVGIPDRFVQDNVSFSTHGVVRGLHYQIPKPQGKLVCPLQGTIFDVIVDVRVGSPTFGLSEAFTLESARGHQLYVPEGFAHGFSVIGEEAIVLYKCTHEYDPSGEACIAWNDPDLGVNWPVGLTNASDKDRLAPRLSSVPSDKLPRWTNS